MLKKNSIPFCPPFQALAAHVKILDYSCTQYRESQKSRWLEKCIDELKSERGDWVVPALKQIREICCLYPEMPPAGAAAGARAAGGGAGSVMYRPEIINKLQSTHALVILVADNLEKYIGSVRSRASEKVRSGDPANYYPDGRYNHIAQVNVSGRTGEDEGF